MGETPKQPEIAEPDRMEIREKIVKGCKKVFPDNPRDFLAFVGHNDRLYSALVAISHDDIDGVIDVIPGEIKPADTEEQRLQMLGRRTSRMPVLADEASIPGLDRISKIFADANEEAPFQTRRVNGKPEMFLLYQIPVEAKISR